MNINLNLPTRLVSGENCVEENKALLGAFGKCCIIVTGKGSALRSGALADMQSALESQGVAWTLFDGVEQNPLMSDAYQAGKQAREFGAEFVVGIGGGSPLDSAKAAAIYAANPEVAMEAVAAGWKNRALPVVAVGITAGTGSEVGPFAVMTSPEGRKTTFSGPDTVPAIAFSDPRYTWSLPWKFTVSSALDALCHCQEGYFNNLANTVTDSFAVLASGMLYRALTRLEHIPQDGEIPHDLREELLYASVLAGITLSQCGCAYPHKLGYFLTEEFDYPHGIACALFTPTFLERAQRLMPERFAAYLAGVGCTAQELVGLVQRLTFMEPVRLTRAEAEERARRGLGSANFRKTAPTQFTEEEAVELMVRIFAGE